MGEKPLRILIADDHEMVRRGLRGVISDHPGWELCGEATTGREAVDMALRLRPHIVIMDITMPELTGLEATRQIRQALPDAQVLILTMHSSGEIVREVLAAGARGYVIKKDAARVLEHALESLQQGKPFLTPEVSDHVLEQLAHTETLRRETRSKRLTPREREIVRHIAQGHSTKEVATLLGIAVKTAETHRTNAMRKIGAHSATDLTRYAIRQALITP